MLEVQISQSSCPQAPVCSCALHSRSFPRVRWSHWNIKKCLEWHSWPLWGNSPWVAGEVVALVPAQLRDEKLVVTKGRKRAWGMRETERRAREAEGVEKQPDVKHSKAVTLSGVKYDVTLICLTGILCILYLLCSVRQPKPNVSLCQWVKENNTKCPIKCAHHLGVDHKHRWHRSVREGHFDCTEHLQLWED